MNPRISRRPSNRDPRRVLLFAPASADDAELFAELEGRADLSTLRTLTLAEAERALCEQSIGLVVVGHSVHAEFVDRLASRAAASKPRVPLLLLRSRTDPDGAQWQGPAVAVLRLPLVSLALSRSVDAALGMTEPGSRSSR
ncbi:MAG: hypothetical protein JST54_01915 [Deltaproteobacteria bacterium]|nr:hypothetical protein [Deltaproteobacteria bacterium]